MDLALFDNIIDFVKSNGYNYTGQNDEDEWFYVKNGTSFDIDYAKYKFTSKYPTIKFPDVYFDLYSQDFLIVTTAIYKEGELLKIFVDGDECNFVNESGEINILCGGYTQNVNIRKYFSQTFIDYKLENIDDLVNSIKQKKDFLIVKHYENSDSETVENCVFVQINVIMNTRLSKYIKKDKTNIFFINDGFLSTSKGDKIKEYVSLSMFPKRKQQELVDIINSYYQNLTIIKKPSTKEVIFGIKGQEFIRTVWNKYECVFCPVINTNIKL
jgi:hypothetical protein